MPSPLPIIPAILARTLLALILGSGAVSAGDRADTPWLEIDALSFDAADPQPGQTLRLQAALRNGSATPVDAAEVRFYQDGRALGPAITLPALAPDQTRIVTLPVRPGSVGRFSFSVVVTGRGSGSGDDGVFLPDLSRHAEAGFVIDTLPGWWTRLDAELANAQDPAISGGRSRMAALRGNALCEGDIRGDMILQRHGAALMAGLRAQPRDRAAAEQYYADALAALSDFAETLYCLDLGQLEYWDRALAQFWRAMAKQPEPDMGFDAAVIATWNPALLVLDAIQFTGQSEIIAAYEDFQPQIDKALAAYPSDSYGAAWLDAFGTGQLVRHAGSGPMDNLLGVMKDPALLGLGTCPLTAHAAKAQLDAPCIERLQIVTESCTATDLNSVLAGLAETGLILPLLHGNFAAQPTVPGQPARIRDNQLRYFGTSLTDTIAGLCGASQSAGALQGMAEAMSPAGLAGADGCGFALAAANLAARGSADRALQCLKGLGSQAPMSAVPSATQVRFPSACRFSDVTTANQFRDGYKKLVERIKNDPGAYAEFSETESNKTNIKDISVEARFPDGSTEKQTYGLDGLTTTDAQRTTKNSSGKTVFEGSYAFDGKGRVTESYEKQTQADGTTVETTRKRDANGNLVTEVNITDPDGSGESYTTVTPATPGRPVEPGAGGCPETAAQARAEAIFNCLFADEMTEASTLGGLGPLINILGGTGSLPAACNALDPGSFWGSSTGGGVTDPVDWEISGGPMVFETFIPTIDGVIDPPKDWTGIPRPPGAPD